MNDDRHTMFGEYDGPRNPRRRNGKGLILFAVIAVAAIIVGITILVAVVL